MLKATYLALCSADRLLLVLTGLPPNDRNEDALPTVG
jgi:hypothetical protein